jgi:hypothetical protein
VLLKSTIIVAGFKVVNYNLSTNYRQRNKVFQSQYLAQFSGFLLLHPLLVFNYLCPAKLYGQKKAYKLIIVTSNNTS